MKKPSAGASKTIQMIWCRMYNAVS